jgi:hypothetical protein
MSKEIWLPDSKTHVIVEDGEIRVWDSMVMEKKKLEKSSFGFDDIKGKEKVENRSDV